MIINKDNIIQKIGKRKSQAYKRRSKHLIQKGEGPENFKKKSPEQNGRATDGMGEDFTDENE